MNEKDRVAGFKALVESHKTNFSHLEEPDGGFSLWKDLSAEGKLENLARDAAMYDLPFNQFEEAVRESVDKSAIEEAALRQVLRNGRELHELEKLFPDDGRTEPTPLVERVSELLNEDAVYSKTEFERLLVEQRDDAAQRPLHEKVVRYEDESNALREILDGKSQGRESIKEWMSRSRAASRDRQSIVDKQNKHPRIDWRGADMRGANLAGMDLEGVDFRTADLRGVNFSGSILRNADFRGALVQGANFQNANLYGAKMQGVEADQADFRGADLRYTNFGGAYLQGAMMPVLTTEQKAFKRIFDGLAKEPKAAGKERENGIER